MQKNVYYICIFVCLFGLLAQKVLGFLLQKSLKSFLKGLISLNKCFSSFTQVGTPTLFTSSLGQNQGIFRLPIE